MKCLRYQRNKIETCFNVSKQRMFETILKRKKKLKKTLSDSMNRTEWPHSIRFQFETCSLSLFHLELSRILFYSPRVFSDYIKKDLPGSPISHSFSVLPEEQNFFAANRGMDGVKWRRCSQNSKTNQLKTKKPNTLWIPRCFENTLK